MNSNSEWLTFSAAVYRSHSPGQRKLFSRKFHPSIKVIAISGGGRVDKNHYLDMAREFGADCIISKPFDPQKIVDKVDIVLWETPIVLR